MSRSISCSMLLTGILCAQSATVHAAVIAHWSFDNTLTDSTGQVTPGTFVSGAGFSGTTAPGVGGSGSLDVTPAAAHFRVESQAALNFGDLSVNDFSFAAWIQPDGAGTGSGRVFDRRGRGTVSATSGEPGFQYVVDQSAGNWRIDNTFLVQGPSQYIPYVTSATFGSTASGTNYSNGWHHVAMAYEAGVGSTFYVDGVFDGFVAGSVASIDDTNPIVMGTAILLNGLPTTPAQHFSGLIDEVFLFDQAVSIDQVNSLIEYNQLVPIPEPSSFLLLGLGATSFVRHTRRRRQRA